MNQVASAKAILRRPYLFLTRLLFDPLLFDPLPVFRKWEGLPFFLRNLIVYRWLNRGGAFAFRFRDSIYRSYDRFSSAAELPVHYFYQDVWAARFLYENGVKDHVDVGSRVDGFVAHVLPFCRVRHVDVRPLDVEWNGFEFVRGSVTQLPFADDSVPSLSCLHVIEHIGLGRYGDLVDPSGHLHAARELARVLQRGGMLLVGTPVGRERLCFDAHRVFDPQTIVDMFQRLSLVEFCLIDDRGRGINRGVSFDEARRCDYGCGLFVFTK